MKKLTTEERNALAKRLAEVVYTSGDGLLTGMIRLVHLENPDDPNSQEIHVQRRNIYSAENLFRQELDKLVFPEEDDEATSPEPVKISVSREEMIDQAKNWLQQKCGDDWDDNRLQKMGLLYDFVTDFF